ncbi:uncharacterized protein J7T54_007402 [Emericellopsis cladophorae]|uniref:ABC transporter domain-containing protein n=1 Tax=Emericellopsis cladophorae TaxID=2686198 RepID=A0A9P9XV27_9HYPO|nr:uncharacterized protein J7T54_007402 [Emericellopsis cladophorae]KAI6778005.1 hypothetical protein J7T54_007402 [Emericellopsis cladophorae]
MTMQPDSVDLERNDSQQDTTVANTVVSSFAWHDLHVQVKDRQTGAPKALLDNVSGVVRAGELLAIMGPSGSGKSTLLNALAHRVAAGGATTTGDILINGAKASMRSIRDLSGYVEQEDALIGSLTIQETMMFAARMALPSSVTKREALRRVDELVVSFGLQAHRHTIVGTAIKKGLSGGQKKRLSVASRLVTDPKILFLDEPTSGLDSTLSLEVCSYLREIGRKYNIAIIASIHQPSTAAFQQFDTLCLLSGGRTCYFGPTAQATSYFANAGHQIPPETNSAEFFLDLINTDVDRDGRIRQQTDRLVELWSTSQGQRDVQLAIEKAAEAPMPVAHRAVEKPKPWTVLFALLHRSWIKSYRDIIAYGIRVVMYLGLAIMMGTVFLRFGDNQKYVQPYINAIFFGGAFMSFMAVAYVPAFLEDLSTYQQERANGLVSPGVFILANFIIGLPFLFLITVLFSVVTYWLVGFREDASAFFMWVMWLFLDLLAAESLVVLVSSIFNIFVVALAVTAFCNGLWMCVGGFLVPMDILNPFWKYVFHYINYQAYVFQGMMVNELQKRTYTCDEPAPGEYQCSYPSDLNAEGRFRGTNVLQGFAINTGLQGTWVGIMIGIIAGYRILAYIVLRLRK